MSPREYVDVQGVIDSARDTISVKRVYGDAHEQDGVTVIPAATVAGGGGGGGGDGTDETGKTGGGGGAGFGVRARPAGVFIVRGGDVRWKPAVDVNRIALGSLLVMALALLVWRSVERSRSSV